MVPPLAHETWFVENAPGNDFSFLGETATLLLLAAALVVTLAVRLLAHFFPGVDIPWLARAAPWMPFAVRIHLAVSLIGLLSLGFYLSPAMDLQANLAGVLLGTVMVLVAVGMATGLQTRKAAWLLVLAGPLGMLEFGVLDVLQRLDLLGLAAYVLIAGPGRWSADAELGRERPDASPAQLGEAIWVLRMAVGVTLIIVALVEKLADPQLALDFLAENPQFNVAREIGLPMGDLEFVRFAGAIEVLFGLLLISGALPQLIVVIAGIPFNATLYFFGNTELVGHLPIYGAMLVLLVYGSDPVLRPYCSAIWPFGRTGARAGPEQPGAAAPG